MPLDFAGDAALSGRWYWWLRCCRVLVGVIHKDR
jgi:hypothetical protein